jgi:hypothetical protein
MRRNMKNTLKQFEYVKSCKYTNLDLIYSECSDPGGLRLTEFMAEKMQLCHDARLLEPWIKEW